MCWRENEVLLQEDSRSWQSQVRSSKEEKRSSEEEMELFGQTVLWFGDVYVYWSKLPEEHSRSDWAEQSMWQEPHSLSVGRYVYLRQPIIEQQQWLDRQHQEGLQECSKYADTQMTTRAWAQLRTARLPGSRCLIGTQTDTVVKEDTVRQNSNAIVHTNNINNNNKQTELGGRHAARKQL